MGVLLAIAGLARELPGSVERSVKGVDFFSDIGFLPAARIVTEAEDCLDSLDSLDSLGSLKSLLLRSRSQAVNLRVTTLLGGCSFFIASMILDVLSFMIFEGRPLSLSVLARFSGLGGFTPRLPFALSLGVLGFGSDCCDSIVCRMAGTTEILSRRCSPFLTIFS